MTPKLGLYSTVYACKTCVTFDSNLDLHPFRSIGKKENLLLSFIATGLLNTAVYTFLSCHVMMFYIQLVCINFGISFNHHLLNCFLSVALCASVVSYKLFQKKKNFFKRKTVHCSKSNTP